MCCWFHGIKRLHSKDLDLIDSDLITRGHVLGRALDYLTTRIQPACLLTSANMRPDQRQSEIVIRMKSANGQFLSFHTCLTRHSEGAASDTKYEPRFRVLGPSRHICIVLRKLLLVALDDDLHQQSTLVGNSVPRRKQPSATMSAGDRDHHDELEAACSLSTAAQSAPRSPD